MKATLALTHRQAEVVQWIANGKSNEEISAFLDRGFFTVKNQLQKIFRSLGIPRRTAAAVCATLAFRCGA